MRFPDNCLLVGAQPHTGEGGELLGTSATSSVSSFVTLL